MVIAERPLHREGWVPRGCLEVSTAGGVQCLRLVHAYVHLGSVVTADMSLGPEVARRAAAARTLSTQVFGWADITVGAKVKAVAAFVDSRLLYNAGT